VLVCFLDYHTKLLRVLVDLDVRMLMRSNLLTGKCFSFRLANLSRLFIQIVSSLLLTDLSFIENH